MMTMNLSTDRKKRNPVVSLAKASAHGVIAADSLMTLPLQLNQHQVCSSIYRQLLNPCLQNSQQYANGSASTKDTIRASSITTVATLPSPGSTSTASSYTEICDSGIRMGKRYQNSPGKDCPCKREEGERC